MLPLERHRLIVELLGQHGVMRVNEIAQATRVSRETIRRDLSELERKGILTRSHGGALAAENPLPATRAAASALPVEDSQGSFQHRTLLADVVLVQLENNLSAIEQVIDAGKQAGALVILNPAPWQPVEHAVLSKVDLLTPNATEAGLMTGRRVDSLTAAAEAADVLHAQGARNVIITLGASGALLSELGVKSRVPCFPSHPRDTTGAGDAFNGALAARLACGEPLQAAARFAAAYAAVSVEKQGASSLPEYLEAQERLLRAAADYEMA
ncbi:PfkB family carbohydrate kinase [Klebsiella pneumoniae]|uniref:PfkB family carbohydrate kinase n=1 Tax=Klebsiella pneumoniae TaxID=573 RepID=UPI0029588188|nr:PfkB family carbohydrate kinase [Klebsiella pneumoniae]MDV9120101.1 PfkB family carbohydrate kinase [Klebsiella pneumoniae]